MSKREFLQKCHEFNPSKDRCTNYLGSEKLDGQRCFWDGGLTRGMRAKEVPFANLNNRPEDLSTGLWSINGKIIFAPDNWLDNMPKIFLDGELYTKRNDRQNCRSIVSQRTPDFRWSEVKFVIFGSPPLRTVFADGKINSAFFKREFKGVIAWAEHMIGDIKVFEPTTMFKDWYNQMLGMTMPPSCVLHPQIEFTSLAEVEAAMDVIEEQGGEGLVLQYKYGYWIPERSHNSLKYKRTKDAEAKVVGYIWGDRGVEDRLVGLMGSLSVDWNGKLFQLSGFTESERRMIVMKTGENASHIGVYHCGEVADSNVGCAAFPLGSVVTFQYRGLTKDGLPVEARYFRKFEVE